MIIAIALFEVMPDEGLPHVVYTDKIATFEHEHDAMSFVKSRSDVILVDNEGKILKNANIQITYFEK